MIAYACIILAATIGYFSGPWWTVLLCVAALALLSIAEQQKLRARFAAIHATEMLMIAGVASVANALLTGLGAYLLGRVVGWLFVV